MSQRLIESLRIELERRHHRLVAAESDLWSAQKDFDEVLDAESDLWSAQKDFDEVYEILEKALLFNNGTKDDPYV